MDQFVPLLEVRLQRATAAWEAAKETARIANAKAEELLRQVEAYRETLAVEKKEKKESVPVLASESPHTGGEEEEALGGNKSALVRELIATKGERGVTPKDVRDMFKKAGVTFHVNYPYAVLRRLLRNKTIKKIRGKYYPADPKAIAEG